MQEDQEVKASLSYNGALPGGERGEEREEKGEGNEI